MSQRKDFGLLDLPGIWLTLFNFHSVKVGLLDYRLPKMFPKMGCQQSTEEKESSQNVSLQKLIICFYQFNDNLIIALLK